MESLQERDGDISNLGDRLLVLQRFDNETEMEIERALGSEFTNALRQLPVGSWQGPVRSGYGLHLVRLVQRTDAKASQLSQVHKSVKRDWTVNKRKQISEEFYQTLRKRYNVKVGLPEAGKTAKSSMSGAAN